MQRQYNYIALGDSYTIGEALPLHKSFPCQLVQLMRKKDKPFAAPEIIAKTGWTTDELLAAMKGYKYQPPYDFASLLIGVNNQYRGRDVMEFKMDFEMLLQKALALVDKKKHRLVVLTIPDYSVTPFAASMNQQKVAHEIEVYNSVIKALCLQYKIVVVDITDSSRKAKENPELLAADKLHPSAKEYAKWAKKIAPVFLHSLKQSR